MHFYIDILIIVSEIFTKECQSANILGWLIHLEAEYNIILGGESKLLGVDILNLQTVNKSTMSVNDQHL